MIPERWRRTQDGLLVLADLARGTLDAHRQVESKAAEAGGMLLGRVLLDARNVVVDAATPPSASDLRRRFRFLRRRAPAQALIDEAWRASAGTRIYLGEWHTHPADEAEPSTVDLEDWRRISRAAKVDTDALFFAVVGRVAMSVFELRRSTGDLRRLTPERLR